MMRKYLFSIALLSIFALFSWWLMSSTFGYHDGMITIASKLRSDFGAHLPLIRSFSLGANFPPQYPFFVGEPIRYHYLFYLVVGLLEKSGLRIDLALNFLSALGLTLLLSMIYAYGKTFFRSKIAGILAVILFLFNGSLSWVEYFSTKGWSVASLLSIPIQTQFVSFGPWSKGLVSAFWNWNIFTNQRHLGLSYGLLLLLLYPLVVFVSAKNTKKNQWRKKIKSLLRGVVSAVEKITDRVGLVKQKRFLWWYVPLVLGFAIFPLLHQAAFIILLPLAIVWFILALPQSKQHALVFVVAIGASLVVFFNLTPESSSLPVWQVGYLSPSKSLLDLNWYWFMNLGLYWLLLPALLIWSAKKKVWWLWTALPFFIFANLFRFSTDIINNHKLVTFFMIALNIVMAGFIVAAVKRMRLFGLLLMPVVLLLTFSGLLDAFPVINDTRGQFPDWKSSAIETWIVENTDPRSQFLPASYLYNPASLAGRYLYLDYGYHAWSMGYNDTHKRSLLPTLWSAQPDPISWCKLLRSENLDAIIVGPNENEVEDGRISVKNSYVVREIPATYESPDGWRVWMTEQICQER